VIKGNGGDEGQVNDLKREQNSYEAGLRIRKKEIQGQL